MQLSIAPELPNLEVNHGTKGFHQIIDQTHGVGVIAVMQADAGMQSGGDDRTCRGRP
jgi:hypothetical protein